MRPHLSAVRRDDTHYSRWRAAGPAGSRLPVTPEQVSQLIDYDTYILPRREPRARNDVCPVLVPRPGSRAGSLIREMRVRTDAARAQLCLPLGFCHAAGRHVGARRRRWGTEQRSSTVAEDFVTGLFRCRDIGRVSGLSDLGRRCLRSTPKYRHYNDHQRYSHGSAPQIRASLKITMRVKISY